MLKFKALVPVFVGRKTYNPGEIVEASQERIKELWKLGYIEEARIQPEVQTASIEPEVQTTAIKPTTRKKAKKETE